MSTGPSNHSTRRPSGSSSPAETGGTENKPSVEQFKGTYKGSVTLTATHVLFGTVTDNSPIKINIDSRGKITFIDGEGDAIEGRLSGSTFALRHHTQHEVAGVVTCSGIVVISGRIKEKNIKGQVRGEMCFDDVLIDELQVTGSFQAKKV